MVNNVPESLHRRILEALGEGVCTIDRDNRITVFNRAASLILAVPEEEAIGRPYTEVIRSDSCRSADLLAQTMLTGENLECIACAVLNASGDSIPVIVNTAAVRDDRGEIIGVVATLKDNRDVELLRKELRAEYTRHDIVSKSPRMHAILDLVPDLSASTSTVLILGPTGSGKGLLARAIHNGGARKSKPFVTVNCGALPDQLLESELFGYRRGAFTDAKRDRPGRFAAARNGTIFLDEIGDLSPATQVKLLRVLQEKVYEPLGAEEPVTTNARVIAATNLDLAAEVEAKRFRADLFYRLSVIPLTLPSLAERREDIPLLVAHFIERFAAETGKNLRGISPGALAAIAGHELPGNVRELQNIIEHAFILCKSDEIQVECLPPRVLSSTEAAPSGKPAPRRGNPATEKEVLQRTLEKHGGSRIATAAEFGIHPSTLWRKMKKFELL
jgi:PAS domain S-box-containing protein